MLLNIWINATNKKKQIVNNIAQAANIKCIIAKRNTNAKVGIRNKIKHVSNS